MTSGDQLLLARGLFFDDLVEVFRCREPDACGRLADDGRAFRDSYDSSYSEWNSDRLDRAGSTGTTMTESQVGHLILRPASLSFTFSFLPQSHWKWILILVQTENFI
jgi:hypothetical protein